MLTGEKLGRAIAAAIALKGVKKSAVAAHFGVRPPSVQDWIQRGTISKDKLPALWRYFSDVVGPEHWGMAEGTDVSPAVLPARTESPNAGYIRLPILAEAAAGAGAYPLDEVVRYVDVLESYIHQCLGVNPRNVHVLTARGNSMTGEIEDGDVMFVQQAHEFTSDGIYILTVGEWMRVKRLRLMVATQVVRIESNDGSPAEEVQCSEVGETLFIQGKVVGWWSMKKAE